MHYTDQQLQSLIKAGRKLEAIKVYKDATGVGLREAKDYVDSLASDGEHSFSNPSNPPLDELLLALCRKGLKIEAIKRYRDSTNCGLKEAKDYIDHLEGNTAVSFDDYSSNPSKKKGFWGWLYSILHGE